MSARVAGFSADTPPISHPSVAITLDRYSHVIHGMDPEAAETVANLIATEH